MSGPRVANTSAVTLAVATAAGNGLAYAFTIAMSRLLGVRDFGELGTVLGIWLIAQIPAVACQLTAARTLAGNPGSGGSGGSGSGGSGSGGSGSGGSGSGGSGSGGSGVGGSGGSGGSRADAAAMLRLGLRLGAAQAAVLALAAVPLAAVLHVGVLAMVWLAVGLLPLTVLFAALGVLQGRSAFGWFGGLLAGFQAVRLAVGWAAAAAGFGPAGVLASTAVASLAAAAGGWWLATRVVATGVVETNAGDGPQEFPQPWGTLLRGTASMGGLLLLTTADLLLAGHFLAGDARGVYASGNVLTRIAFWGPQFISTLAYPWLVRPADRARARRLALLAVGGIGLAGVLVATVAGPLLVTVLFGTAYRSLGPLAPLFVLVGAAAAVLNVVLLDDVATARTLGTRLAFAAIGVEAVGAALWWHSSPGQVVGTAAAVCSVTAALAVLVTRGGAAGERPGGRHRTPPEAAPAQRLP